MLQRVNTLYIHLSYCAGRENSRSDLVAHLQGKYLLWIRCSGALSRPRGKYVRNYKFSWEGREFPSTRQAVVEMFKRPHTEPAVTKVQNVYTWPSVKKNKLRGLSW
jgi:hypothetical protein